MKKKNKSAAKGNKKIFKSIMDVLLPIFQGYNHDYIGDEGRISQSRFWYNVKHLVLGKEEFHQNKDDKWVYSDIYVKSGKHKGQNMHRTNRYVFGTYFNNAVRKGLVDDSFMTDDSRDMGVGDNIPHIVFIPEKGTVADPTISLAEKLGTSYYISRGQSSIYGAKKMIELIREVTEEPIILITATDLDKAGENIYNNLTIHFDGAKNYRIMLTMEQVERFSRTDDQYKEDSYSLDVLSKKEFRELFMESIPEEIVKEILDVHEFQFIENTREREVTRAVNEDSVLINLNNQLDEIQSLIWDRENTLEDDVYEKYDNNAIVKINNLSIKSIYNNAVTYQINKWNYDV